MSLQSHNAAWVDEPALQAKVYDILVADDDTSMVHLLEEYFQADGHRVARAYDGQGVLQATREKSFDLIVMDVNMPMLNGLRVFQFLRASEATKNIPVIFITGELSKDVYPAIAHAPRAAYVKKPFDLESFNSLVREFLENYPRR